MKGKTVFYWLVGILIVSGIIAAAFYFDDTVRDWITAHQNESVHDFMRNVSRFGDWSEHFVAGLVLIAAAWWRGSKKWMRVFLAMLIVLAVAGLASRAIKISTARARPSVKMEELVGRSHFSEKYHSFPSGHVTASTAFFAVLIFASWRIGLPCLAIPLLIGFSRLYLAAHYLSDVVCAAVLGTLCALVVWHLIKEKTAS